MSCTVNAGSNITGCKQTPCPLLTEKSNRHIRGACVSNTIYSLHTIFCCTLLYNFAYHNIVNTYWHQIPVYLLSICTDMLHLQIFSPVDNVTKFIMFIENAGCRVVMRSHSNVCPVRYLMWPPVWKLDSVDAITLAGDHPGLRDLTTIDNERSVLNLSFDWSTYKIGSLLTYVTFIITTNNWIFYWRHEC